MSEGPIPEQQKEYAPEEPQPIELHAILTPNGEWKIKCPLLDNPSMRIFMKGFIDELHDTVKAILANPEKFKGKNKIQPARGGKRF